MPEHHVSLGIDKLVLYINTAELNWHVSHLDLVFMDYWLKLIHKLLSIPLERIFLIFSAGVILGPYLLQFLVK